MDLENGTKLGPYEIVSPAGAGGMGEVYRARDTRLDRIVAVKILPEHRADTPEARQRFEREARTISALNHPNICTLHDIGHQDGIDYLVMEYLEGETLADRLAKGPLPPQQMLKDGVQICEGLEKAHRSGVVHRDLKPGNIMLTKTGVKLMDFGLAKAAPPEASGMTALATASKPLTAQGSIVGTFQYMAPEQIEGKEADVRSDIFALGAVLYEMATGKRAFEGKTQASVIAAILERDPPPISSSQPMAPPALDPVVKICLAKDPDERWQTAHDVKLQLQWIARRESQAGESSSLATPRRLSSSVARVVTVAAMLVVIAVIALVGYWRLRPPEPRQVMQLSLALPEPLYGVFSPNPGSPIAVSPDGARLVFVAAVTNKPPQLYLRSLDQQTAAPIAGTEDAVQPFFSSDGQSIGFFATGKMRRVSVHGGPATILCEAPIPHGASWVDNDTIVFAPSIGSGLMRVSAAGGTPQTLTIPNAKGQEVSHRWPQVLPGGKAVLLTIQTAGQGSYDDARIAVLSLETGRWRTVLEGGSYARYVPSGHIVYARAGALMAVPFDLKRLEAAGSPAPVQEGVFNSTATSGGAGFAVADSGLLAYVSGSARAPNRSLVWVDRHGVSKELPAPLHYYAAPRISPDGKLLAVQVTSVGTPDIWVYEFARNTLRRITVGPAANVSPLWTPDGRSIVYSTLASPASIRSKPADGTSTEEVLLSDADPATAPNSLSPDGKVLLFGFRSPEGIRGIQALSLEGNRKTRPFLQAAFEQVQAQFSPDGRWVAYRSNESGRDEIYVQPFPGPGGKWMISTGGGSFPRWLPNGREIFFLSGNKMMSVPVEMEPTFKAGTPAMLFDGNFVPQGSVVGSPNYDVAPDGQHFLMIRPKDTPSEVKELNVVVNWFEELKRRLPAGQK